MKTLGKHCEVIRYKYGLDPKFTAYCVSPATKPKLVSIGGKKFMATNLGSRDPQSRHFQSPGSAQAWAAANRVELVNPDCTPLEGSRIWAFPLEATSKERRSPAA